MAERAKHRSRTDFDRALTERDRAQLAAFEFVLNNLNDILTHLRRAPELAERLGICEADRWIADSNYAGAQERVEALEAVLRDKGFDIPECPNFPGKICPVSCGFDFEHGCAMEKK